MTASVPVAQSSRRASAAKDHLLKKAYWARKLSPPPPASTFALDAERQGGVPEVAPIVYAAELALRLERLSKGSELSAYVTLAAITGVLLYRYHPDAEVLIGIAPRIADATGRARLLPVRVAISAEMPFKSFLLEVRKAILEAYANELPGGIRGEQELPAIRTAVVLGAEANAGIELAGTVWSFHISQNGIAGQIRYHSSLFGQAAVKRLAGHHVMLLESALADLNTAVGSLRLLTPREEKQLLHVFNDNAQSYPLERTLPGLFEMQVARTPDRIAVWSAEGSLTYAALDARSNRLAGVLLSRGVKPGDFVGILARRSAAYVEAILGILKAGCAWVSFEVTYPKDRIRHMLEDSGIRTVITDGACDTRIGELLDDRGVACIVAGQASGDDLTPAALRVKGTSQDPAYMIYTSGTTGVPKGTVIRHDGAVNHIFAQFDALRFGPDTAFLQSAPASSDISVWQFLAPLLMGGRTVIAGDDVIHDAGRLFRLVRDAQVTVAELVPPALRQLLEVAAALPERERALPSLAWMMATGETVLAPLVNHWLSLWPEIPVVNCYGPSEAADDVLQQIVNQPLDPGARVPIGKPLANIDIFITDPCLQPVPVGVYGEICVAGVCVGAGYWRDAEKTAARFLPNPFRDSKGAVLYKTGDVGRWLEDGSVDLAGRMDRQVKLRGFRIELGEIEAVLSRHPAVREAVAVTRGMGDDKTLAAYIVLRPDAQDSIERDLRAFAKKHLPAQMVPSVFVVMERLPVAASGKLDRTAFPDPGGYAPARRAERVLPSDAAELAIKNTWEEVLGTRDISVDDNFFDVGGHSLNAVTLAARLAQLYGPSITVRTVFERPTIAAQAALARQSVRAPSLSSVVPINPHGTQWAFFCVHPGGGMAHAYIQLSARLGLDRPFHAFQSQGLEDARPPLSTVEEMAELYIRDMRAFQSAGPYLLGGWSFGAVIAAEMAVRLAEQGEEAALVALLDGRPNLSPEAGPVLEADLISDEHTAMARNFQRYLGAIPDGFDEMTLDQKMELFYADCTEKGRVPAGFTLESFRRLLRVTVTNDQAGRRFRSRPYPGRLTLFRSEAGETPGDAYGWEGLAGAGVEIHAFSGDHLHFVSEPNVGRVAEILTQCMDRALSGRSNAAPWRPAQAVPAGA